MAHARHHCPGVRTERVQSLHVKIPACQRCVWELWATVHTVKFSEKRSAIDGGQPLLTPEKDRGFSRREQEVWHLIAMGFQNQTIANKLNISVKTVEFHKENLKRKVGVATVRELYVVAGQSLDTAGGS